MLPLTPEAANCHSISRAFWCLSVWEVFGHQIEDFHWRSQKMVTYGGLAIIGEVEVQCDNEVHIGGVTVDGSAWKDVAFNDLASIGRLGPRLLACRIRDISTHICVEEHLHVDVKFMERAYEF